MQATANRLLLELCDQCQCGLEPGQIGLCEACQPASAATPGTAFATFEPQANGKMLVVGDPDALYAYIKPMSSSASKTGRGVMLTKQEAHLINCIPLSLETLPSGAVLEWHLEGGVGIRGDFSCCFCSGYIGIAENRPTLERHFVYYFGPEAFRRIFGKEPLPGHVAEYVEEQAAIAARKAENAAQAAAQRMDHARRTGNMSALSESERAQVIAEQEEILAQHESRTAEAWMSSVGRGVVGNPRYQAFLDTVEDVESIARSRINAPYFSFIDQRCAEYAAMAGHCPMVNGNAWHNGFTRYCREWADARLSERVKRQRAA